MVLEIVADATVVRGLAVAGADGGEFENGAREASVDGGLDIVAVLVPGKLRVVCLSSALFEANEGAAVGGEGPAS